MGVIRGSFGPKFGQLCVSTVAAGTAERAIHLGGSSVTSASPAINSSILFKLSYRFNEGRSP
jgi:hypothetical protein